MISRATMKNDSSGSYVPRDRLKATAMLLDCIEISYNTQGSRIVASVIVSSAEFKPATGINAGIAEMNIANRKFRANTT
jgi:hypothetical protein